MLALGIGANTAIFSLVSAVFLRPLPFPQPGRLVAVWEEAKLFNLKYSPPAVGNFVDWRARNRVFEGMGALEGASLRLTGHGDAEEFRASIVTPGLFQVLGVKPAMGRSFLPEEERPGAGKTVILSHRFWQARFGGDAAIVGRQLVLNAATYTVAGVMPAGFHFPNLENDLWVPAGTDYRPGEFTNRGRHNLMVVARLKPGVTLERANQDLAAIAAALQRECPRTNTGIGAFATPLREHFTVNLRGLYGILLAAVGFVLLIACANFAGLLLARAAARQREIAVRMALGASRAGIARGLLAESLMLSSMGAVLGLVLAWWSFDFLGRLVPKGIAGMAALRLDGLVLAFTAGLVLLTAVVFGVAPVLHAVGADLNDALKQGGGRTASGGSGRLRGGLVIAEVALSLVLLTGAGLMIQSFARLRGVDPGFPAKNLLTARVPLSFVKYRDPVRKSAFFDEVLRRVRALPGVTAAGVTNGVPVAFKGFYTGVLVEGADANASVPTVNYRVVSPGYLETLRLPLDRGRYLAASDTAEAPRVGIVNETMARRFWPGEDAVGRRFKINSWGPDAPWYTVVGVVADLRTQGLDAPPRPEVYLPYTQQQSFPNALVVRAGMDPKKLAAAVRREIRAVDGEQPVSDIMTMDEILDREVFVRRLQSLLLGVFSAAAVVLSALGIYGLLSFTVTRRSREFGVRLALGARPGDILAGVVRDGLLLSAVGIGIGTAAALALTRVLKTLLFGVAANDPWTFAATAACMLLISLAASMVPAWRAMRVDPIVTLREE
jgi:putative ABC transport system permease protein